MTEARLQEIEERLKRITPRPWALGRFEGHVFAGERLVAGTMGHSDSMHKSRAANLANAEFIAHAPQDIADLLAEVKALRVDAEEWKAAYRSLAKEYGRG